MATIMEMLNQGIGGLNTPLGMLGTNLLAQSGPQQGNPNGGARLGQALAGMSQQQAQQALQQHRTQQNQLAEQMQQLQAQQFQAKQAQAQRQQTAMQDPNLQAQLGPMAKQLAALGMPLDDVLKAQSGYQLQQHRDASLAQNQSQFDTRLAHVGAGGGGGGQPPGPKAPMPRQVLEEPLSDGRVQKHLFDAASGQYKPYGAAYYPYSQGKSKAATGAEAAVDQLAPDPQADLSQLPGQGPLSSYAKQPMQGAELLMHGSGSNPMARPGVPAGKPAVPSNATAAGILGGITPPNGQQVVQGILNGITPTYGTPPKASAQGPAAPTTQAQYDALPAGASYIDPSTGRVAVKRGK